VPPSGKDEGDDGPRGGSRGSDDDPSPDKMVVTADHPAGQKHAPANRISGVLGTADSVCFQIIHAPSPGMSTSRINCRRMETHFTDPRFHCSS